MEQSPISSLPNTNMKTSHFKHFKNPWITLPVLFGIFTLFMHFAGGNTAEAQKAVPEEAQAWITSINSGSAEWKKQMAAETAAHDARMVAEQSVRGLRLSLCAKYNLVVNEKGETVEQNDCSSFQ